MNAHLEAAPPAGDQPIFRTMAEASRSLGVHPSAVSRRILRGIKGRDGHFRKLVASRIGGRWMVRQGDLDLFIEALTLDRINEGEPAPIPLRLPASRRREIERAEREAAAAGI